MTYRVALIGAETMGSRHATHCGSFLVAVLMSQADTLAAWPGRPVFDPDTEAAIC